MISHKHKCIFLHIPKCAGTTVNQLISDNKNFNYLEPDYEYLYGWCPERKLFMQHATIEELIETDLISNEIWNSYNKFTIIRNPWERLISSYNWIKSNLSIKGNLNDFIELRNEFSKIKNLDPKTYRKDHLKAQSEFIFYKNYSLNNIYRFEDLHKIDFKKILNRDYIEIYHLKKSKKRKHYSNYYSKKQEDIIGKLYINDIKSFNFQFEDKRSFLSKLKNLFE